MAEPRGEYSQQACLSFIGYSIMRHHLVLDRLKEWPASEGAAYFLGKA